jgi:hypothetical protein
LANALAVDDKTFFSGAYIGATIDQCFAYITPTWGARSIAIRVKKAAAGISKTIFIELRN